jgi:hypothetical protein
MQYAMAILNEKLKPQSADILRLRSVLLKHRSYKRTVIVILNALVTYSQHP